MARRRIDLPAAVVFDRITALHNHERLIPLTKVSAPRRRPVVGDVAVATTAGVLDDTMRLLRYQQPGRDAAGYARWAKTGPVLIGEADITVTPLGPRRCLVEWAERDVHLAGLPPRLTTRPLTVLLGIMTTIALARFARLCGGAPNSR